MQNTRAVLQKVGETHLPTLSRHWEATERGRGHEHVPPPPSGLRSTGRTRESLPGLGRRVEKEAGESRPASSEALQAGRGGRVVGVWESHRHGEGPEG